MADAASSDVGPGATHGPSALLRRLPFLLLAALGIWLWKGASGSFPVARELVIALPAGGPPIREVDLQLYDGDVLLKREVRSAASGLAGDLTAEVSLRDGEYRMQLYLLRAGTTGSAPEVNAERTEVHRRQLSVREPKVFVSLR